MGGWESRPHRPEADRFEPLGGLEGAEARRSRSVRGVSRGASEAPGFHPEGALPARFPLCVRLPSLQVAIGCPMGYHSLRIGQLDGAACGRCSLYSSIHIRGFRGLDSFRMRALGRVNLLVGTNNCGKTSILESIELLRSTGHPNILSSILQRRGEWGDAKDRDSEPLLDVKRLFSGYDLQEKIVIEGERDGTVDLSGWNSKVAMHVVDPRESEPGEPGPYDEDGDFTLAVKWSNREDDSNTSVVPIGITPDGHLSPRGPRRFLRTRNGPFNQGVQFIRTSGMTAPDVVRLFDNVVLTENEEHVTQALRTIEPAVERIASVVIDRGPYFREAPGGVFIKLRETESRIPIGSMGDGMWRMLGLALALADAKGGVLLVDEIDTGLHYSVMADMWRMVSERAAALKVQVFATTHSRDCYESLAAVAEPGMPSPKITIQRIEPQREQAIRFNDEAIVAAAERGIEAR